MATKYEYYITGDNIFGTTVNGNYILAQSFTPSTTHRITKVVLKLFREGTIGLVNVAIQGDDSNKPDGSFIATGTIDGTTLTTNTSGTWYSINFSLNPTLTATTKYWIILSCASTDGDNNANWRVDTNTAAYAGGNYSASTDSGSSWAAQSGYDLMFEEWGRVSTGFETDKTYSKQLISIANNELWYESPAGTMKEFTDANDKIDTTIPLNTAVAFQKLFIANGTNLKIADFANTKIATDDIGAHPPHRGVILLGNTSGATMIVDYITAIVDDAASTIYGKRTSTATFSTGETVTGTNPSTAPSPYYSGASGAVSFAMTAAAEVAPPHWYDWTVYGADDTNYGAMPTRANQVCNFMGCLMLGGDPNYPHQWYMPRQFNPFDWLYTQDDAQSAVAGNDADAGEVGDIIKVNIPYKDDYVVHACASTLWYMTGHPCAGGTIVELDLTTGILGDRAFCWDDVGNLYMMCTVGLLRVPPGFGQPENLTIELWPDFITDLAFNASTHRITLAFNPEDRGIHIFKTTLADGTSSAWWYDLRTEGLFPDSYSTDHGVFSAVYYQSENPLYRKLLFGCNDGYIRFLDRTAENDDSTAINSYVGFAPLSLSTHPRKDGIIKNIDLISGGGASAGSQSDSSDVLCSVHVGRTAEQIIEKLDGGTTAAFTKTFTAPGFQKGNMDRRPIRGQWSGIVLSNVNAGESWSMERLIIDVKEAGRSI